MLIRVQDKSKSISICGKLIGVDDKSVYISDGVHIITHELFVIGRYKSEERAMQVLDSIEHAYEDSSYTDTGIKVPKKVFQMPKE